MKDDELFEAEIARLIQDDCAQLRREARVPPAELVWLRAEVRAREEAARRVFRPILLGQALGVAALMGLLAAILERFPVARMPQIPATLIEVVLGSWLLLAPVALYLAFSRDN